MEKCYIILMYILTDPYYDHTLCISNNPQTPIHTFMTNPLSKDPGYSVGVFGSSSGFSSNASTISCCSSVSRKNISISISLISAPPSERLFVL